ncbi:hypothetical protein RIF29_38517 [Crotalaria pallida]|uniref:Uncharacterized protein n=1 Tax=Crotalaria pallida TaxID=3830 RepID=A0AAN9HPS4_CROPI
MAFFTRLNATHFHTGANEGNEGVAVGKERIFKRVEVEKKSLMGDIAFVVSLDESVDAEGVERVNVTQDGEVKDKWEKVGDNVGCRRCSQQVSVTESGTSPKLASV